MKTAANTQEHLCTLCPGEGWNPECREVVFGDGFGLDNIIGCECFEESGAVPDSGWAEEVE